MHSKENLIILYILCWSFLAFSQDTIRLIITDETETLLRIEDQVLVTIQESEKSYRHGFSSFALVDNFQNYTLTIKARGYHSKEVVYQKENLNSVQYVLLQPKFNRTPTETKSTTHLTTNDLVTYGFPTLNDALTNTTGAWMTRPIFMNNTLSIRGFTGNQNRIIFNDIPINNAMMGNWNNRSRDWLGLFPISEIQEVNIVRSPNPSTMGGSINLETRMPDYYDGTNITGYGDVKITSSGDRIVHGGVDFGRENFALTANLSRNTIGNITSSNNLIQQPSGFQQISGNIRGLAYLGRGELEFGYHGAVNNGERIPLPNTMSNFFSPLFSQMSHQLAYAKFNYISRKGWFRLIGVKGSYQNMSEQLVRGPYQLFQNNEENRLHSGWLSIAGTSNLGEGWKGFTTLEWRGDQILNSASIFTDTLATTSIDFLSRYPTDGRASSFTLGHNQSFTKDKLTLLAGIEGNLTTLSGATNIDTFTIQPFSLGSYLETGFELNKNNKITAKISYNYRPLSFEDMPYLGGQGVLGGSVIFVNEELRPENSLHFELGHRFSSASFRSSISIFRSQLYNGVETVITIPAISISYLTYENNIQGYIQGIEAEFDAELGYDFQLRGSISYLNGQVNLPNRDPRFNSNIPPLFGSLSLRYLNSSKFSSDLMLQFAGTTTNIEESDVLYTFIDEGLNGSWQTLNWSIGYELSVMRINAGIRNILDAEYYRFGSYIQDYGRTFWVGLQVNTFLLE